MHVFCHSVGLFADPDHLLPQCSNNFVTQKDRHLSQKDMACSQVCIKFMWFFSIVFCCNLRTEKTNWTLKVSIEYRRQSFEGYPTKVNWSIEVRVIKNKKATETQELDRFGPSVRRNTLLLWSVGLYWLSYDITYVLRGPPTRLI